MPMTLKLPPDVEAEFTQDAVREGANLQDHIDKMIVEAVKRQPPLSPEEQRRKNQAALDMLKEWDEEDKTDDPDEIARRQAEWEAFKAGMNSAHISKRVLFP